MQVDILSKGLYIKHTKAPLGSFCSIKLKIENAVFPNVAFRGQALYSKIRIAQSQILSKN
ncbi:hypothetical protein OAQ15_00705 [Flavobacteriaceae bacterium]|nr:hypothetical protein [Flavobacteriaceae bacterium]